jgi:hypothetical protein
VPIACYQATSREPSLSAPAPSRSSLTDWPAIEIASFPTAHRHRVERALNLASRLHAADRRQREPYVSHGLRVAIRIISHYRVRDPDVAYAALLHDAVEDHAGDPALGGGGPPGGAGGAGRTVWGSCRRPGGRGLQPHLPGRQGPAPAAPRACGRQPGRKSWARVVKASDLTDKAVGLIHTTGPKLEKLAGKYAPLVPVLRQLILRPDTPLGADVKEHIAAQLDNAAGRFAALWHGPDCGDGR